MSPYTKEQDYSTEEEEWADQQQPRHYSIELDQITQDTFVPAQPIDRIAEIELVHRLDKRLLLFAMFGNLVKTLDNSNLGNSLLR